MTWPVLAIAAATVVLVVSGCGHSVSMPLVSTALAPVVTIPRVPSRDRFIGTLRDGTGSLIGARDLLEARLQAVGTTGTRRVTLWIVSTGCRAGSVCVHLTGSLRGKLVPVRTLPDIGQRYAITATGSLYPVGAITAVGTVAGTGNAAFGSALLHLILSGRRGSARLSAAVGAYRGSPRRDGRAPVAATAGCYRRTNRLLSRRRSARRRRSRTRSGAKRPRFR